MLHHIVLSLRPTLSLWHHYIVANNRFFEEVRASYSTLQHGLWFADYYICSQQAPVVQATFQSLKGSEWVRFGKVHKLLSKTVIDCNTKWYNTIPCPLSMLCFWMYYGDYTPSWTLKHRLVLISLVHSMYWEGLSCC